MATILFPIKSQFLDDNGAPLSGGKVYTYEAGTTTPLETYTSQDESIPNTNPVILNALGYADIWLKNNESYKIVVKSSDDSITHVTADNVSGIANILDSFTATGNLDLQSYAITSSTNSDILLAPLGTGVVSVALTPNYELNVTSDDAIPNKKFCDDRYLQTATQAQVEAATSTTVGVSPGRLKYSPYVINTWVTYDAIGGVSVSSSNNVTSVVSGGTGIQTITFTTAYSNANYGVVISNGEATGSVYAITSPTTKTTSTIVVKTRKSDNSLVDVNTISIGIYGDFP